MRIVLETRRPVRGARLCARFGLLLLLAHASALPAHASALAARAHSVSVAVEDAEGVYSVRYELEARPVAAMPHVLGRAMLRRAAERLLEQVRGEMLRRAAAPRAR